MPRIGSHKRPVVIKRPVDRKVGARCMHSREAALIASGGNRKLSDWFRS